MIHKASSLFKVFRRKGFVLVSVMVVMSLLVVLVISSLAILSVETRSVAISSAQREAESNARLALVEAISQLQELAGSDQRVMARAAILENPDGASLIANRNWLGVWRTTYEVAGRDWPLIGKAPDLVKTIEPYDYKGIYTDLRYRNKALENGKWREKLRLGWLVSKASANTNVNVSLDISREGVVEMLGRGTLGDVSQVSEEDYKRDRVLVEKVKIDTLGFSGSYAWYVSDNSQKASLHLGFPNPRNDPRALASSALDNVTSVETGGGEPYGNYLQDAAQDMEKVISNQSAALTASISQTKEKLRAALGADTHHFTTDSGGLFTDPILGGFKKDLTPLMFGLPSQERIEFAPPYLALAAHSFSSRYPIIPGERKAVQGPSFAALRDWGMLKSELGKLDVVEAQLIPPAEATRQTPSEDWVYGVSDGKSFKASKWAEHVPKLRPVMTDCRYHFYFSYTGIGEEKKIRTHLIPRVCIWNPYSIRMKLGRTTVLMPNTFGSQGGSKDRSGKEKKLEKRFHFFFSDAEVARLKEKFKAEGIGSPSTQSKVAKWSNNRIYLRGNEGGLFPEDRFLGFTLEESILEAGECLVFSPRIDAGLENAQGVKIQEYDVSNIARNILSASEPQGEGHFTHGYASDYLRMDSGSRSGRGVVLPLELWQEMQLSEVTRYGYAVISRDNLTFVWKGGEANGSALDASKLLVNLQTMNYGNGGVETYDYWYYTSYWGDSGAAFGNLEKFVDAPRKDAPSLHQLGVKLLWLDESSTEANDANPVPLRVNVWDSNSLAYNPSIIANWNVRPHLVTRSPASPVGKHNGKSVWYATGCGAWFHQFEPKTPQDFSDMPEVTSEGKFVKPALTLATQPSVPNSIVLFDLPDPEYGSLSLGNLRHAQLSPFSWHPTYIVGHSLVDLHAPFDASSHSAYFENSYEDRFVSTGWEYAIGGGKDGDPYSHGPRVDEIKAASFMQLGNYRNSVNLNGIMVDHSDEHLAYDISFEVNQNIWDQFFFSGMPLNDLGSSFDWDFSASSSLDQLRYIGNRSISVDKKKAVDSLHASLDLGFWLNGYLLKNKAAFNVNSTSVKAWTAFLSGLRGLERNAMSEEEASLWSRLRNPSGAAVSEDASVHSPGGWRGARILTDNEVKTLAEHIVREVKLRGPFISMADFVNRRLAPKSDSASRQGALDAAIMHSGLNNGFNEPAYSNEKVHSNRDNNHADFKPDVDKLPETKAWGVPGFITQSEILEPFAPAMTVRGDVFVIRCYGESCDSDGNILATAYLEAIVERSAEYVDSVALDSVAVSPSANRATDPALKLNYVTGALEQGNLSRINQKYGRKFVVKSMRWLHKDEI